MLLSFRRLTLERDNWENVSRLRAQDLSVARDVISSQATKVEARDQAHAIMSREHARMEAEYTRMKDQHGEGSLVMILAT